MDDVALLRLIESVVEEKTDALRGAFGTVVASMRERITQLEREVVILKGEGKESYSPPSSLSVARFPVEAEPLVIQSSGQLLRPEALVSAVILEEPFMVDQELRALWAEQIAPLWGTTTEDLLKQRVRSFLTYAANSGALQRIPSSPQTSS